MRRISTRAAIAFAAALTATVTTICAAAAQDRIGVAAVIRNEVVRVEQARLTPISVGDGVVRNETVRTGADSDAKLVLLDDTNLSIGPSATLTLDRTVFSGGSSYRQLSVRLSAGAFRFISGHSPKDAYQVRTPLATLAVRGTTVDILVQRNRSIFTLQDGQGSVRTNNGQVANLLNPGDSIVVELVNGVIRMTRSSGAPVWSFAGNCARNASLCGQSQYASASPFGGSLISGELCGR
jgi:hypothetical protein